MNKPVLTTASTKAQEDATAAGIRWKTGQRVRFVTPAGDPGVGTVRECIHLGFVGTVVTVEDDRGPTYRLSGSRVKGKEKPRKGLQ